MLSGKNGTSQQIGNARTGERQRSGRIPVQSAVVGDKCMTGTAGESACPTKLVWLSAESSLPY
jgi:hypothetical protein